MHHEVDIKQLRFFGLIVGGIFLLLGVWPTLFHNEALRWWGVGIAGGLGLPALFLPKCLQPVYRVWMFIGEILGWINTRIILSVVFYCIVTPIGFVQRLRGHDAMRRQWETEAETYRVTRESRPHSHMTHQY